MYLTPQRRIPTFGILHVYCINIQLNNKKQRDLFDLINIYIYIYNCIFDQLSYPCIAMIIAILIDRISLHTVFSLTCSTMIWPDSLSCLCMAWNFINCNRLWCRQHQWRTCPCSTAIHHNQLQTCFSTLIIILIHYQFLLVFPDSHNYSFNFLLKEIIFKFTNLQIL